MRATAPTPVPPAPEQNRWQRAALHDGVARQQAEPPPWA
jgi:hypothetical protein